LAEKASPVDKPAASAPPSAAASGDEPAGEGEGAAAPAEGEGAGAAGGDGAEDPASPAGAGEADPAAAADGAASDALAPVPEGTVGIMRSDELMFDMIDIRERKLEVRAFATRSSAQDRLAAALQGLGCLTNISKGKVRDQNDRKVFTMSMDNACFTAPMGDEEAES